MTEEGDQKLDKEGDELLAAPATAASILDIKAQQQRGDHQHQSTSMSGAHHRQPAVGITAVSCRGCRPQAHPYARIQPWAGAPPAPQQAPAAPTRTRAREPAGPPEHAHGANPHGSISKKWPCTGTTSKRRAPPPQTLQGHHQGQNLLSTPLSSGSTVSILSVPQTSGQTLKNATILRSLVSTSQNGHTSTSTGQGLLGTQMTGNASYTNYEPTQVLANSATHKVQHSSHQRVQGNQISYQTANSSLGKGNHHHGGVSTTSSSRSHQHSMTRSSVSQKANQQQQNVQTTRNGVVPRNAQMSHSLAQLSAHAQQHQQQQQQQHYQGMSTVGNSENWLLGNYLTTPSNEWCQGSKSCSCIGCTTRRTYSQSQTQTGSWYYPQHEASLTSSNQLHRLFQNV